MRILSDRATASRRARWFYSGPSAGEGELHLYPRQFDHVAALQGVGLRADGLAVDDGIILAGDGAVQHVQFAERHAGRLWGNPDRGSGGCRLRRGGGGGLGGGHGGTGRARPDDHGLLEFLVVGAGVLVDVFQFMLAEANDVAVTQGVLLDELAVDVGAVGAAQILKEGIVQNGDDERVLAAHGEVVDLDVVVGFAADGGTFLGQLVFLLYHTVQAEYEFRHAFILLFHT